MISKVTRYLCVIAAVGIGLVLYGSSAGAASGECRGVPTGYPCFHLEPASGPIGSRIEVSGTLPARLMHRWRPILESGSDYMLVRDFREGQRVCEIQGGLSQPHLRVSATGDVKGSFVVAGGKAPCNQDTSGVHAFSPGDYSLMIGCQTCMVDTFTITAAEGALPRTGSGVGDALMLGLFVTSAGLALSRAGHRRRT